MYTIFINDAAIYLTDKLVETDKNNFYKYDNIDYNDILKKLEAGKLESVYLYHDDLNYLWNNFKSNFKIIKAAGGIVFNDKEEILWIYRNDRWDLPKGKIEKGEKRKVAAIREVQEECGIHKLSIEKFITTTYHMYEHKDRLILKVTFWYEMCNRGKQVLKPQSEEGITEVKWVSKNELAEVVQNTYASIKLLLTHLQKK